MQMLSRYIPDDRIAVIIYFLHLNDRMVVALEQLHLLLHAVVHAAQLASHADRPVHRNRTDAQHLLNLFHQLERIPSFAVQLVDEREDQDARFAQTWNSLIV